MKPPTWLACVGGLSFVVFATLVAREPAASTTATPNAKAPTNSAQGAANVAASNMSKPSTVPAARIVVAPPAKSERDLLPSTALDSHASSPGLHAPADVRVAERTDTPRYDGALDAEASGSEPVGATLEAIEPASEIGLGRDGRPAMPRGARQP